ncbi:MAG: acyl-CoA dehydrogenase family protein [Chloroflexi bacterium]|nr:acyl-CoA dehydrogenase family protein [Chloroflexota bacterium]MBI2976437.1 acyl-CoA dehydrogenase family protein [Chloroflexota bacterium]MBI3177852.1 acyl-CoA dehydrogenase family protein [Chloroflexota bacterium]MBI4314742.1 acyl-CoA dehydrogenase family protein [Chloroflexota bacterium]MBI5290941.1 acyl-CoA dehydrogenase family protein [Chloroflexota bacterium]
MDFSLTEEQTMFRDLFRDFAEKEVAKIAEHVDRSEEPPLDLYKKAAAQGFFGAPIPEAYGGVGIDWLSYTLLAEELGKHCLSTAVTIAIHTSLAAMSILDVGTEEQKQKHLPAMAAGEVIGAFALTEPDAGSDPGSLTTRADKVEGGYRLNGTKNWVSNAGLGGVMVVFASTHPGARHKGISAFVVANDAPGVMIGYREKTLGLRGMDIRTVYLEDCFVPEANRLNGENEGWAIVVRAFDRVRLTLAAVALGAAQTALALGVTFAAERKQFGVQIAHKQAMQNYVADTATDIEALRGLVRHAAWLAGSGQEFGRAASMAKYFGGRVAKDAANKMLQVHGGYGFSDEYAISRYYRDVRALRLLGGTDEIQRYVVARAAFEEKGLRIQP